MDEELQTGGAADPSIQNLTSEADNNADNVAMLPNLLKSLEAEGAQSGPVTNILREMGICPPRISSE